MAIVCLGPLAIEGLRAAEDLAKSEISAAVVVLASVSPPPTDDLLAILSRVSVAVTVEAHYVTGGIGSLISEVAAGAALHTRVVRCGVQKLPAGVSGSERGCSACTASPQRELRRQSGPLWHDGATLARPRCVDRAAGLQPGGPYRERASRSWTAPWPNCLPIRREFILVVNGSTDGSAETCRRVAQRCPGVHVIETEHKGWGRAVKLGLAASRGETHLLRELSPGNGPRSRDHPPVRRARRWSGRESNQKNP